MHAYKIINLCIYEILKVLIGFAGHSDGSGEDDMSPMSGTIDRGSLRQFPDHQGRPDQAAQGQQDMDYSSTATLWSNSSR